MKRLFLLFFMLILLSIGFYYLVTQTDFFAIKRILFEVPVTYIRPDDFEQLLGQNLVTTQRHTFHEVISANPYVESFTIDKIYPSTLKITCKERAEFAAILFQNLYIIVDHSGIVLDIREEAGELMLLEGFVFKSVHLGKPLNADNKDILARTIKLMLLLKQNATFPYSVKYNNGIEVTISDQLMARFGEGDLIEEQFIAFMTIYGDIQKKGIGSGIIDVSKKDYYIFKPLDY